MVAREICRLGFPALPILATLVPELMARNNLQLTFRIC
jgi:hypothetical protein